MTCSNSKKKKINVLIVQNLGKVKGIHNILSEVHFLDVAYQSHFLVRVALVYQAQVKFVWFYVIEVSQVYAYSPVAGLLWFREFQCKVKSRLQRATRADFYDLAYKYIVVKHSVRHYLICIELYLLMLCLFFIRLDLFCKGFDYSSPALN